LGSPGTIGSSASSRPRRFFRSRRDSPLMHFDATLSVLLLRLPRPPPSHVDHDPGRIVPRISFSALQHFRIREPFFSLPRSRKRRRTVALVLRSLTLGFGYPLDEMAWLPHPGGPLSAPNALGLRSSELSSSRVIEKPFQVPLPLLHFPAKPLRPCPGAPAACSHPESRAPSLPPECLARVGTSCSLELSDLAGSPPAGCEA
jgi:hypothetical protein